jgi:cytochrome c biogenesis protein CcmG/thiol:disulfide interchange protein DsbE
MTNNESQHTAYPESNVPELIQSSRRKHIIAMIALLAFAVTVVGILIRGLTVNPNKVPSALLGKPAKSFSVDWLQGQNLMDAAGNKITLESFRGKPLVLNFWASWCGSCREEAVYFENFWQKHKDEGVAILGVAIQDTEADAMKFANFFGKTYMLGLDTNGKASIDYGVYGVPETFFIDRNGIIRHKEAGPVDEKMLAEYLALIK